MGIAFLKVASIYLLIGVCLGMYMGLADKFQYTAVHAHINLLGWATMALFGLIYHYFPRAGNSKLGKIHFWLHNIGSVVLIIGMIFLANQNDNIGLPLAIPRFNLSYWRYSYFFSEYFSECKKRSSDIVKKASRLNCLASF